MKRLFLTLLLALAGAAQAATGGIALINTAAERLLAFVQHSVATPPYQNGS